MVFLFSGNGGWNEELTQSSFLHDDGEAILRIKLPKRRHDDEIIWNLDKKKGVFSIKSAYFLSLKLVNLYAPSSSSRNASRSM